MSISISAIDLDPDAETRFEELPASSIKDLAPRVTRSKALNGESVIENRGFVEGDRTFTISVPYSEEIDAAITQIYKSHPLAYCGTRDGIFTVAPFRAVIEGEEITLTLFVKEKH